MKTKLKRVCFVRLPLLDQSPTEGVGCTGGCAVAVGGKDIGSFSTKI